MAMRPSNDHTSCSAPIGATCASRNKQDADGQITKAVFHQLAKHSRSLTRVFIDTLRRLARHRPGRIVVTPCNCSPRPPMSTIAALPTPERCMPDGQPYLFQH